MNTIRCLPHRGGSSRRSKMSSSGYELRKGTVRFPLTKPVKLIRRIAKLRAAGIAPTSKKPLLGREKKGASHSRRQKRG
jgi:hypothetical protein